MTYKILRMTTNKEKVSTVGGKFTKIVSIQFTLVVKEKGRTKVEDFIVKPKFDGGFISTTDFENMVYKQAEKMKKDIDKQLKIKRGVIK